MTKRTGSGKSGDPSVEPGQRGVGDQDRLNTTQAMRNQAEEIARARAAQTPEEPASQPPEALRQLLHELRVHQIELEMQNEELRRAQMAIEDSRARYFDLYDLAPVGYLTVDEKGLILEANLTAATLLGVTRGALLKKRLSSFILPVDQDLFYRQRQELSKTSAPQASELRMMKTDGSSFWARLEATAAEDADGAPVSLVVVSDVTEHRRAEERERQLASERETRVQAEEAIKARDEFITVAAHELKTPVTSLQGYAQLMLRELGKTGTVDTGRLSRAMERIERQSKRLVNLSEQLLSVSRIQSGKLTLSREETAVSELLEKVVEDERDAHPERAIELHNNGPDRAYVDPLRLEQVLVNLLDNAIKFSPPNSNIDVDLDGGEQGWVRIAVRDRGAGIPEDKRERIFDRYYQANPERHLGGMGVGLFVSRQTVEMHGGSITVEQPEDGGSRFVVCLPTNRHDSEEPSTEQRLE